MGHHTHGPGHGRSHGQGQSHRGSVSGRRGSVSTSSRDSKRNSSSSSSSSSSKVVRGSNSRGGDGFGVANREAMHEEEIAMDGSALAAEGLHKLDLTDDKGAPPSPPANGRHRRSSGTSSGSNSSSSHGGQKPRSGRPVPSSRRSSASSAAVKSAAKNGPTRHDEHREHRKHQRELDRQHSSHGKPEEAATGRGQAKSQQYGYMQANRLLDFFTGRSYASYATSTARRSSSEAKAKAGTAADKAVAPKPAVKRLGTAELGKYAHEERMPDWLVNMLKARWGVCRRGIVTALRQQFEESQTTEYVYLCDPRVSHVSKLAKEGGFCGYRNIQTMVSYIIGAKHVGFGHFEAEPPDIFSIQHMIESAWNEGISAQGRIETGGIYLTRKYIGTPEALAMFKFLGIPCTVRAFKEREKGRSASLLLREVESYFEQGKFKAWGRVRETTLPPIYLQHPGHSLTIVGIEKTRKGGTNLIVFDPMFEETTRDHQLSSKQDGVHKNPDRFLKPYRRGRTYLDKFKAFEILKLEPKEEDLAEGPK